MNNNLHPIKHQLITHFANYNFDTSNCLLISYLSMLSHKYSADDLIQHAIKTITNIIYSYSSNQIISTNIKLWIFNKFNTLISSIENSIFLDELMGFFDVNYTLNKEINNKLTLIQMQAEQASAQLFEYAKQALIRQTQPAQQEQQTLNQPAQPELAQTAQLEQPAQPELV